MKISRYYLALSLLTAACAPEGERAPRLAANADWTEPRVSQADGAPLLENEEPGELLAVDRAESPIRATRILFWGNQAAALGEGGYQFATDTEDHEILMFDADLTFLGALFPQGPDGEQLQRPYTVTAGPDGRLAAFEAAGTVTLFDRWGREFQKIETPFAHAVGVWSGSTLTLARSPYRVPFAFESPDAPLLVSLDPSDPDGSSSGVGTIHGASQAIYIHAANAGTVTLDGEGNVYYAALGRPEVEKYSPDGKKVWSSRRPVEFDTPEPRLVPNPEGSPRLLLATVQKATAIGPDGLLYVRSAADEAGTRDRLDVLDPGDGTWLRTAALDTGTAVLVGAKGSVWELSKEVLLASRDRERREFKAFALETFDGEQLSLSDLRGKVVLVAFWASWCGPCRDELPLLDSLELAIDRPDFEVIGINEDVNEEDGRSFAQELGLQITMLLGRGEMRARYHYSGLPYSVLLDREGRIVREYYGFGGREAFDTEVGGRVLLELGASSNDDSDQSHDHTTHTDVDAEDAGESAYVHSDHEKARDDHAEGDHNHGDGEGALPGIAHEHDHGPTREVRAGAIEDLARHLQEVRDLHPTAGTDVADEHWELVLDGLAEVDDRSTRFMEEFPGNLELVRLLSLRTQLYVDVDRLPNVSKDEGFADDWERHLTSIDYLVMVYQELEGQAGE